MAPKRTPVKKLFSEKPDGEEPGIDFGLSELETAKIHAKVNADFVKFFNMQAEERAAERREAERIRMEERAWAEKLRKEDLERM